MRLVESIFFVIFSMGCSVCVQASPQAISKFMPTLVQIKETTTVMQDFKVGERWRMTCLGKKGADGTPIFARITRYNKKSGEIKLIVTDRDGFDGRAWASYKNGALSMFDSSYAAFSDDGKRVLIEDRETGCPKGFEIVRLI